MITGTSLEIQQTPLTDLRGLESVETVESSLWVEGNLALTSLAGLENLTRVGGLIISGNTALASLEGLSSLETIDEDAYISANDALESLTGLTALQSAGSLEVRGNPKLVSLVGLEALSSVAANLAILDNPELQSVDGLQSLATVGNNLGLYRNAALTSLAGLKSITNIGGGRPALGESIALAENGALTSLEPLHDWPGEAVKGEIQIYDNPNLPQCEVDNFDTEQTGAICPVEGKFQCVNNDGTGPCTRGAAEKQIASGRTPGLPPE